MKIAVHDHVIVGAQGRTSMKALGADLIDAVRRLC